MGICSVWSLDGVDVDMLMNFEFSHSRPLTLFYGGPGPLTQASNDVEPAMGWRGIDWP